MKVGDSDEEGLSEFAVSPYCTPEPVREKKKEAQEIYNTAQEEFQERHNYKDTDLYKKFQKVFDQQDTKEEVCDLESKKEKASDQSTTQKKGCIQQSFCESE